jgi:hypothetical protein
VNLTCRRVYFALSRLWSTASYTPMGTWRKLALSFIVPPFLYCDVVYSKTSAGLRHKLQVAFNSCARYVYGVSRRDHIYDYAYSLLTPYLPSEGKFFSFRICCQMYNIISIEEPGYLHDSIQFGRLGGIIIPRHNYVATAASFFVRGAILWSDLPLLVREGRWWRWEVQGKVSVVHGADSKQLIFLIRLKSFMVGKYWVFC